jgi:hypothetical protein
MKRLLLLSLILVAHAMLNAQSMEFLDANRVKAGFWADGTMFWDKISEPLFEWPQDSGTHVNFTTGLWLGGLNSSDTLKGAYKRYGSLGEDYFPGPLTIPAAAVDSITVSLYNRVWKINKTEVDQFILCHCLNPSDPSCVGYVIPNSIAQWPGNPIPEASGDNLLMDQQLAPYHDENGDLVYDPNDCDYPLVKCDQSLFFVFNDRGGVHAESQLSSIGIEIRAMAYACSCDTTTNLYPELDNTVFLDLEMIHRGNDTLFQTFVGLYSDADIGGSIDDYFGTNVEEGYIYHYNADAYDADYAGAQGYGSLPPAHGIVYLQGPWMDANGLADYWDPTWDPNNPPVAALTAMNQFAADSQDTTCINAVYGINGTGFYDNIPDNEKLGLNRSKYEMGPLADPITGNNYYLAQKAFWYNSTAQVYGCNGYPTGSCAGSGRAYFTYPDVSDPWNWGTKGVPASFNWSEFNSTGSFTANPSGDRRSVSAAGPFTLMPGETNTITYAFVTARTTTVVDSLSLSTLNQAVINVKNIYYQGIPGCGYSVGLEKLGEGPAIKMFPNPAHEMVWLESADLENAQIRIVDMMGRCVFAVVNRSAGPSISLPVDQLVDGIYTITISMNGWNKSLKLVKN